MSFYPKSKSKKFDEELFKNPTSEYRGAPFWAWNCKADEDMLCGQIECLKGMGFGGFHMHSRSGMAMPYLGQEFMHLVRKCVEKAKSEGMRAFLYDEDRWPSGFAGGLVTADKRYREHRLLFTTKPKRHFPEEIARNEGKPCFIGAYDIILSEDGALIGYARIDENAGAKGQKRYAYIETADESAWFNNQAYADVLDKESVDRFIDITYGAYKNAVGNEFGKTVKSIFTDEPRFAYKKMLPFALSTDDVILPWTYCMAQTFAKEHDYDICDRLPELVWNLPDGAVSQVRYHFYDHLAELFARNFSDNCGSGCRNRGLAFTGHMPAEPTLTSQARCLGEVMRSYRAFDIPGIDMLCDNVEITTAKQCRSAVNQYGREAMVSELYGVTNWDFDFRGHKFQGDWQAALGVTLRVPHLSLVSMAGEAKRDYPASINYQSPWCMEYRYIEDHYARINTALTRGKPIVRLGVIHPIESYWLNIGPDDSTLDIRNSLDEKFENITQWLVSGCIDFDFISESLLPSLFCGTHGGLCVGEMKYDAVLVPACITLRSTTVDILNRFVSDGGRVIFAGKCPEYTDAVRDNAASELFGKCVHVEFDRMAVLNAVECVRTVEIKNHNGARTDNLIYTLRADGDDMWLFVAHFKRNFTDSAYIELEEYFKDDTGVQKVKIYIDGCFRPVLYDTLSGTTRELQYFTTDSKTVIEYDLHQTESLLVRLMASDSREEVNVIPNREKPSHVIRFMNKVEYELSEPNVLLLDRAEYSLNGEEFNPEEEILILDNECRKRKGWPLRQDAFAQPWVEPDNSPEDFINLRFTFDSRISVTGAYLALEDAERVRIVFNGKPVKSEILGWFADKSIKTIELPPIRFGKNELVLTVPFGRRTNTEWCYILGNFGVKTGGTVSEIVPLEEKIGFGDITSQGLPFYGANITYKTQVETPACTVVVHANYFRGSLIKVLVDGKDRGIIAFSPYQLAVENLSEGMHTFEFVLFGNRVNTFGAVHKVSKSGWFGPDAWRTKDDKWCYEYNLTKTGIFASPVLYCHLN